MKNDLEKTIDFLNRIGLKVHVAEGVSGFCEGVLIKSGEIFVDPGCSPSSLLHEAGHIACIPDCYRTFFSDDLKAGMQRALNELNSLNLEPEHHLEIAMMQCSDPEATAWAWAAGIAIGLEPEHIILDSEYGGVGAEIRLMLSVGQYFGINGLKNAGMCNAGKLVPHEMKYPKMIRWLQSSNVVNQ